MWVGRGCVCKGVIGPREGGCLVYVKKLTTWFSDIYEGLVIFIKILLSHIDRDVAFYSSNILAIISAEIQAKKTIIRLIIEQM